MHRLGFSKHLVLPGRWPDYQRVHRHFTRRCKRRGYIPFGDGVSFQCCVVFEPVAFAFTSVSSCRVVFERFTSNSNAT
ncbi:hypothetical protein Pla52o_06270 [Novipirellula galeiformis]|uniref:Uncharacterized protein n=1 Tax=Novipirellula galeiformis TaxID=2528004 RepID=A0A5C6CQI3_9BACT|nr:hypothetical protein Pla52o_06270 [Novipirellula galeiformis]